MSVNCGEARCKRMPTDFYGNVPISPQEASPTRGGFVLVVALVRHAAKN
ncbi:MAG: hypothetical protein IT426_18560 [Pirellulales bacterium]|nr:hypothetical protein [Pirellulales bacterium]